MLTRSSTRILACMAITLPPVLAMRWSSLDPPCGIDSKVTVYKDNPRYGELVHTWGDVRGGWRGSVLANGKIFGIPTNATTILEIDPETRSVSTFGNVGGGGSDSDCAGHLNCGVDKWIEGVLVPSGKILGIPFAAESVLEIDPVARTATTWGVLSSSVKRKWLGGVLADNGMVYAIPYDSPTVLEIVRRARAHTYPCSHTKPTPCPPAPNPAPQNPETNAVTTFGNVGYDSCKWYGGVLAPNGRIYTIPYSAVFVMEIVRIPTLTQPSPPDSPRPNSNPSACPALDL